MKKRHTNLIRRYRRLMELTQTELGLMIGTYQRRVSRWERGSIKVPMQIKTKISEALRVPINVLFPDEDRRGR